MKRDLEMIREIMMLLEKELDYGRDISPDTIRKSLELGDQDLDKLIYHLGLLEESTYIKTIPFKPVKSTLTHHIVYSITNKGHDFLDAVRQDNLWQQIKSKVAEVGGFTLAMVTDIGLSIIKKELDL